MNQLGHLPETPTFQKSVGEVPPPPSPKESLASSVDSFPRFGDMDPKSGMSASSEEDTTTFGFSEILLS
jgi:hypothetical protein